MDVANNGAKSQQAVTGLVAMKENTFEILKALQARGIKEKNTYVQAIKAISGADLPKGLKVNDAFNFAVCKMGTRTTTDDERTKAYKLMEEQKWEDDSITVPMIVNMILFMAEFESNNRDHHDASDDDDSDKKRKKSNKKKRGEHSDDGSSDNEDEEDPYHAMIGSKDAPKLSHLAIDLLGDKPKLAHPDVYKAAQVVVHRSQTYRELAQSLHAMGVGLIKEECTSHPGFGLMWEFLKEVMRAAVLELLRLNGTEVNEAEFRRATEHDEWAEIAFKAATKAGKKMWAHRRLRNNLGKEMRDKGARQGGQRVHQLQQQQQPTKAVPPPPPPPSALPPPPPAPASPATQPVKTIQKQLAGCFKCGQQGHFKDNCPNKLKCFNCNKEGHMSNECPMPKKKKFVSF